MAQNDFTEDKATLFGAGMVTVGVFGKTALITKGVGVVAATKAGVLAGGFICPPAAICIGLACVGAGLIKHFGKLKLVVKFITGTINSFPDSAYMSCGIGND